MPPVRDTERPAMRPALTLRLGQQLKLTPQLQQALRLLAMPAVELELELRTALDENPMLEASEGDTTDGAAHLAQIFDNENTLRFQGADLFLCGAAGA